jgi:23S rRNA (uridine2552-2'-O)-methyltransferase
LLTKGDTVVDLGAAPGGWCQVAKEIVDAGVVIGVDKEEIRSIPGIIFIQGDITEQPTVDRILRAAGREVDVVLSDLSPDISGKYSMDHAKSVWLAQHAFAISKKLLRKNGNFLCKIFEGEEFRNFFDGVALSFRIVKTFVPMASRKRSSEVYIIGKKFKGESRR